MKTILNTLGYRGAEHCHLDSDLVKDRRRESISEWTPAFGQINQSAAYLKNQHISEGDLFLFFGSFRHLNSFAPEMPGAGTFLYDKKCMLTMPGKSKAIWKYCQAYDTDNMESKRKNSVKGIRDATLSENVLQYIKR